MICSLPAPDSDGWQSHHDRIDDLERQLAEAQGKLKRIETDMCTGNRG